MPHYKTPEEKLWFLDDPKHEHVLPAGCVWISDDDAEAVRHSKAASLEVLAQTARQRRDALLTLADCKVNTREDAGADASEWRAYRKALRDVPQGKGFPIAIIWPKAPE